jgi:hypothetical protein
VRSEPTQSLKKSSRPKCRGNQLTATRGFCCFRTELQGKHANFGARVVLFPFQSAQDLHRTPCLQRSAFILCEWLDTCLEVVRSRAEMAWCTIKISTSSIRISTARIQSLTLKITFELAERRSDVKIQRSRTDTVSCQMSFAISINTCPLHNAWPRLQPVDWTA